MYIIEYNQNNYVEERALINYNGGSFMNLIPGSPKEYFEIQI